MGSEIEVLMIGNCLLLKEERNPALKIDYKDDFELDWSDAVIPSVAKDPGGRP
jgi:hypothetical protein